MAYLRLQHIDLRPPLLQWDSGALWSSPNHMNPWKRAWQVERFPMSKSVPRQTVFPLFRNICVHSHWQFPHRFCGPNPNGKNTVPEYAILVGLLLREFVKTVEGQKSPTESSLIAFLSYSGLCLQSALNRSPVVVRIARQLSSETIWGLVRPGVIGENHFPNPRECWVACLAYGGQFLATRGLAVVRDCWPYYGLLTLLRWFVLIVYWTNV